MTMIWCQEICNASHLLLIAKEPHTHAEINISEFLQLAQNDQQLIISMLAESDTKTPCFTGLLPAEVTITETGFNAYVWNLHTRKALKKIAKMGGKVACLDNGPSKFMHWEHEQLEARQQLFRYMTTTCQTAQELGIKILLEPLKDGYTNHLNSLDEVQSFIALIDMPNLGLSVSSQLLLNSGKLAQESLLQRIKVSPSGLAEHQHIQKVKSAIALRSADLVVSLPCL
ncbi:MAG: hypothetical protein QGI54_00035 [Gammaproteobacteria bacterium]|jgi:hypothetical protein|nr:hypothetical protein [Gammaproteobacteria bacterium]